MRFIYLFFYFLGTLDKPHARRAFFQAFLPSFLPSRWVTRAQREEQQKGSGRRKGRGRWAGGESVGFVTVAAER